MKSWTRRRRNTPWWRSSWGTPSEPRRMRRRETKCCKRRWNSSSPLLETWPQTRGDLTEPTPSGSSETACRTITFHSGLPIISVHCVGCAQTQWTFTPSHAVMKDHENLLSQISELNVDQLLDWVWIHREGWSRGQHSRMVLVMILERQCWQIEDVDEETVMGKKGQQNHECHSHSLCDPTKCVLEPSLCIKNKKQIPSWKAMSV